MVGRVETQPSPQVAEWLSRQASDDHLRGIRKGMTCNALLIDVAEQVGRLSMQMQEMQAVVERLSSAPLVAPPPTKEDDIKPWRVG